MTILRRAAKVAYDRWVADVRSAEPRWEDLPQSHRDRLVDTQRAAFEFILTCDLLDAAIQAGRHAPVAIEPRVVSYAESCFREIVRSLLEEDG